jgi:uncharacterized protein RhaS with RHS repeats
MTEYNYFRDYDASTGRYVESDPAGLRYSLNTYSYLDADPVDAWDPLGLGRATNPHPRPSRIGVFGCQGLACLNGCGQASKIDQVSLHGVHLNQSVATTTGAESHRLSTCHEERQAAGRL